MKMSSPRYPDPKNKMALQAWWSQGRTKPTRKKGFFLMELPGEIRNLIYSYVYDYKITLDLCGKRNDIKEAQSPKDVDKTHEWIEPPGRNRNPDLVKWRKSAPALHLTSKRLSKECASFFYGSLTVISRQISLSVAFLDTIRPSSLQFIQNLQLNHSTYGEPKLLEDRKFKAKHDCKWAETCLLVVKHISNLKHLTINLLVNDNPFILSLEERWVRPLLYFAKLKNLSTVDIHIFSRWRRKTAVDPNNAKMWQGYPPHMVRQLIANHKGNGEIHELFGWAIAMKILKGYCDDCAMQPLMEKVNGKYRQITQQSYWSHLIRD